MTRLKCLHFQNQLNLIKSIYIMSVLLSRVDDGRKIKRVETKYTERSNSVAKPFINLLFCVRFSVSVNAWITGTYTTSSIKKKKNKMTLKEIGIYPQGIYDARLCSWCCNYLVRLMIFNLLLCIYFISFGKKIRWPKE